jgi:hypothetical protein
MKPGTIVLDEFHNKYAIVLEENFFIQEYNKEKKLPEGSDIKFKLLRLASKMAGLYYFNPINSSFLLPHHYDYAPTERLKTVKKEDIVEKIINLEKIIKELEKNK